MEELPVAKQDIPTKVYMNNNDVVADVFNYLIYGGRQVIRAESLESMDTQERAVIQISGSAPETEDRFRDVMKQAVVKTGENVTYLIVGIENQENVHYAMPVRVGLYDMLRYTQQVSQTAEAHRKKEEWGTRAEFLSGFHREDRLKPVLTAVINFSGDPWDGPRSIYEMLEDVPPEIMELVQDYKIHLIDPAMLTESDCDEKFSTDFGKVMKLIGSINDPQKANKLIHDDPAYRRMRPSAAMVLKACVGIDTSSYEEKEEIDMAGKIDGFTEWARKEGMREGIREGRQEGERSMLLKNVHALMETMHLTEDQAFETLHVSDEEQKELRALMQ